MPVILKITLAHLILVGLGSVLYGALVFGTGFTGAEHSKQYYVWGLWLFKVLDFPAYPIIRYFNYNEWIWIVTQCITSFVWANIYLLLWSVLRKSRN